MRLWWWITWIGICTFSVAARAQPRCPEVAEEATAAEQAFCWSSQPQCEGVCLENVVAWCEDAALDDSRVAEACFLAALRSDDFAGAMELSEYITDPSPTARRCTEALAGTIQLPVVTLPEGARVYVDDDLRGVAPVEVSLTSPFWEREVRIEFEGQSHVVDEDVLRSRLQSQTCRVTRLVVEGPETQASTMPSVASTTADGARVNVGGWVLLVTGASAVVAGGVLMGLGANQAADVRDAPTGSLWADVQGDADAATTKWVAGQVLLGVGGMAAAGGLLWLVLDRSSRGLDVAVGPTAVTVRGRF